MFEEMMLFLILCVSLPTAIIAYEEADYIYSVMFLLASVASYVNMVSVTYG